jgi:hypothetical protein
VNRNISTSKKKITLQELTEICHRKEIPKQHFSKKLRDGKNLYNQRNEFLAINWRDVPVYVLTTSNEDITFEVPGWKRIYGREEQFSVMG